MMKETPSPYRSMISARSRRLRTVGFLLLIAALGMAVYGTLIMMPILRRSIAHTQPMIRQHPAETAAPQFSPQQKRMRRIALVQATTAYAYWTVCALLVLAALFVAWLDLREVQRNYLQNRLALWAEATRPPPRNGDSQQD